MERKNDSSPSRTEDVIYNIVRLTILFAGTLYAAHTHVCIHLCIIAAAAVIIRYQRYQRFSTEWSSEFPAAIPTIVAVATLSDNDRAGPHAPSSRLLVHLDFFTRFSKRNNDRRRPINRRRRDKIEKRHRVHAFTCIAARRSEVEKPEVVYPRHSAADSH